MPDTRGCLPGHSRSDKAESQSILNIDSSKQLNRPKYLPRGEQLDLSVVPGPVLSRPLKAQALLESLEVYLPLRLEEAGLTCPAQSQPPSPPRVLRHSSNDLGPDFLPLRIPVLHSYLASELSICSGADPA